MKVKYRQGNLKARIWFSVCLGTIALVCLYLLVAVYFGI